MVVLFVEVTLGVVFRALGQALIWYDELASVLLAWLTFYGAALASVRRAHIGCPELVEALPWPARRALSILAQLVVIAFFVLLGRRWRVDPPDPRDRFDGQPVVGADERRAIGDPDLGGADRDRRSHAPDRPRSSPARRHARTAASRSPTACTDRACGAMTIMLGLFAAVLALVLVNVPIAVALGVVAIIAMVATHGIGILPNLAIVTYNGATSFPLLAIPLFILAGAIMNASGISRRLIAFASSLFGWIRGGLAHVSIGASLFFAEISGSAVADVAALGSILIPG